MSVTCRDAGFALLSLSLLIGCTTQDPTVDNVPFEPDYRGIETNLLSEDLVSFDLTMTGARDAADLRRYGDCAAAQYALIRGYGYARHLRTTTQRSNEIWTANAIYTISAERPPGIEIIVAEDMVATCLDAEIPTV